MLPLRLLLLCNCLLLVAGRARVGVDGNGQLVLTDGNNQTTTLGAVLARLAGIEDTSATISNQQQSMVTLCESTTFNLSTALRQQQLIIASQQTIISSLTQNIASLAQDLYSPWKPIVKYPLLADVCSFPWEYVPGQGCHKANFSDGCAIKSFEVGSMNYTKVRGRLVAHQKGTTNAFCCGRDEISIFTADNRHIWAYTVGLTNISANCTDQGFNLTLSLCPALNGPAAPPEYGSRWYCESQNEQACNADGTSFFSQPLFSSRPSFEVDLNVTTNQNLEVRVCLSSDADNEDIFFDKLELYVR